MSCHCLLIETSSEGLVLVDTGIDDFPEARIHLLAAEKNAAVQRSGLIARGRYRPIQFRDHSLWETYEPRGEMNVNNPRCTPGLKAYQLMMDTDRAWRFRNQKRLRDLIRLHGDDVRVFSAHDYLEFEALRRSELSATGSVAA